MGQGLVIEIGLQQMVLIVWSKFISFADEQLLFSKLKVYKFNIVKKIIM